MKKSKKLLSVLLAVIMVFSAVAVPASAAIPNTVDTFDKLVQPAGLAGLVEWLLTSLNNRKDAYMDTVLNFVCTYVEDINAYVPEGTDLFDSKDTAKKATYVMNFLDDMLTETNLNGKLGDDILNITNNVPGLTVNLNSVDGILATLESVNGVKGVLGGAFADLNLDSLMNFGALGATSAQTRKGNGDLAIVKNLIQFLADNKDIFVAFLNGNLDLGGILNTFAAGLVAQVNSYAGEITAMIEDLVYEKLLGAPDEASSFKESEYQEWKMDEVLVGALYKLLTGTAPEADDQAEMAVYLNSTIYKLLTANADKLYDKFLLSLLNEEVIPVIKNFATEYKLTKYFNMSASFSASEFNFAGAQNGILGEFNNVVVALLNKLLAKDVLDELNLKTGDNSNLNKNLENVIKYILPILADVVDRADYDFTKYTAEFVADKELDYLAVDILKIFFPEWFNLADADKAIVAQMDTMGEVATMAVYYALKEFNPVMFEGGYDYVAEWDAMIFDEDNINDLGNSYWGDIMLGMAVDAAFYGLALNGDNFSFDYTLADIKTKKAAGWGYEEFLGAVADWAIGMVKGLPAVTDKLPGDAKYGPFYEINVLLNELIDWSFLSNCSNGSFTLDIETLVFDGILSNVYEFDIAGILGLFAVNDNAGNILNMNTAPAILSVADRLLTALFENNHGTTKKATVAATCDEMGHTVTACATCGLYVGDFKETAATGHSTDKESLQDASCKEGGIQRTTCSKCDYVLREKTPKTDHKEKHKRIEEGGKPYDLTYCSVCGDELKKTLLIELASVTVTTAPNKVEYGLNSDEELDLKGLVLTGVYTNDKSAVLDLEDKDADFKVVSGLDLTKEGEQTVTVSYDGKTASFTVTVKQMYVLGDINGDKKIEVADARLALRAAVALETLDEVQQKAGDVDGNGEVEVADARKILRYAVGLETW